MWCGSCASTSCCWPRWSSVHHRDQPTQRCIRPGRCTPPCRWPGAGENILLLMRCLLILQHRSLPGLTGQGSACSSRPRLAHGVIDVACLSVAANPIGRSGGLRRTGGGRTGIEGEIGRRGGRNTRIVADSVEGDVPCTCRQVTMEHMSNRTWGLGQLHLGRSNGFQAGAQEQWCVGVRQLRLGR